MTLADIPLALLFLIYLMVGAILKALPCAVFYLIKTPCRNAHKHYGPCRKYWFHYGLHGNGRGTTWNKF